MKTVRLRKRQKRVSNVYTYITLSAVPVNNYLKLFKQSDIFDISKNTFVLFIHPQPVYENVFLKLLFTS